MSRPWLERRRIHRAAKQKLGLKQSPTEHIQFMRDCIQGMVENGDASDENEAELICQMLWEEGEGDEDFF